MLSICLYTYGGVSKNYMHICCVSDFWCYLWRWNPQKNGTFSLMPKVVSKAFVISKKTVFVELFGGGLPKKVHYRHRSLKSFFEDKKCRLAFEKHLLSFPAWHQGPPSRPCPGLPRNWMKQEDGKVQWWRFADDSFGTHVFVHHIFVKIFGCLDAQVKVNDGISLICVLSSILVCTNTNILTKERRSRSRPKVFQKELGFKARNHSKSFKHPPVTSTNFLPCHKTSSNPFPITSTPPNSPANGRRIPADPDGSGRGKWLAAEQERFKKQVISCKHMQAVHLFISIPSLQAYQKGDPCHVFFVNMLLKTAVKRRS